MRKVKVVTDSTSSLPKSMAEESGIDVIPARIIFGAKGYPDDGSISAGELFDFVESADALPQSVAVHEYQFQETFQKWLGEDYDVFFMGVSSKLAETVNNALSAAARLVGGRIGVVDSLNVSSGMGLQVLEAAEMAGRGASLQEITARANALRDKVRAGIVLQTLKYVYLGGRCSKFATFIVGAMNAKPVVNIIGGEMAPGEALRGKNYLDKFLEQLIGDPQRVDPKRIFVTHCLTEETGEVKEKLKSKYGFNNVIVADASPATSMYVGPGSLGVMFMYK
jgi:DegV family protein with EDD domain